MPTANPFTVMLTARAPNNSNPDYTDSYSLTVNEVAIDYIEIKLFRVDKLEQPAAQLTIDILVIA
ncbi:hypothetical protein MGN01_46540 [Methylobacterium gnaphalii]|uniref:Uncharacterized protein n=1 Tax=Methylobacterium gnaphalii TaxID=1010610 RepID=A0A512JS87_9HYPH|nr:hypothetical protein MGN01_46540 [Methylobacterium gnaphalii]